MCLTLCDPIDCSSTRLFCPWGSPGKSTGVGCHFLLQGIFLTQGSNHKFSCIAGRFFFFFFFLPLSHQGSPSYWSIGRPQVFSFRNGGTRLQSQAAVFQMLVNKRAAVSAVAQDGEEWTLDPLSFWGCRATILCLINCNAPKGWGYHVKHLSSNPWFANYNSFTL